MKVISNDLRIGMNAAAPLHWEWDSRTPHMAALLDTNNAPILVVGLEPGGYKIMRWPHVRDDTPDIWGQRGFAGQPTGERGCVCDYGMGPVGPCPPECPRRHATTDTPDTTGSVTLPKMDGNPDPPHDVTVHRFPG